MRLPILRAVNPFPLSLEFVCKLFLTNGQLDKDGEEEEDGLVGGGQVDAAVQADQEDQLQMKRNKKKNNYSQDQEKYL